MKTSSNNMNSQRKQEAHNGVNSQLSSGSPTTIQQRQRQRQRQRLQVGLSFGHLTVVLHFWAAFVTLRLPLPAATASSILYLMVITFSLEQKYIFERNMSRSAVNYKYINKYGSSSATSSSYRAPTRPLSYLYLHPYIYRVWSMLCNEYNIYECDARPLCLLWAVGCGFWVLGSWTVRVVNNRSNSPGCHTFWMIIKVAVK